MRQGMMFVVVGLVQVAIDWLAFVSLTTLGVDIGVANVAARLCGAAFGYVLNGTVTFSSDAGRVIGVGSGARFVATWCAMTLLGTLALIGLNALHVAPAWLMKLVVEACLAVVSFVVMRTWVYGRPASATI
ncbi:GtrA family protein [Lysobacter sp. A6]|uniref:GtrA family protein n=1 Tax=Noviluteimonas lactosilytica TaxID=2888523 RepID=A0ABS8JGA7_9GAMM|nr:GtrA family protein [Lysobacter lactosilyticus]MCC8362597.1 GtrA family protein [Lysobacter lactosilyticus]